MANKQIKDFTQDTAPSGSDLVLKQTFGGGIGSTKTVTLDDIVGLSAAGDITQVNITAGTGLSGTINTTSGAHTQTLALSHLGIQSLSDPDADRILFWDDSATGAAWLTVGSNLTLSGTTLTATDTNTQLSSEQVQDIVGAMFSSNTETRVSVTYDDSDGTIDVVVDDMTADTQLTTEQVEDIVGAMFSSNTETRISATYQDADGTIDLVVDDMTADTTYSAGNGISLSTTTFSVAAGSGLSQDSSGLSLSHLGLQDLADPDADRIIFWDDSEGALKWLTAGTNLTISGTTISASGGGSGDITRVNITAGTGLTGTTDTTSGDHTQTLALSHLGIQSLSDPDADRIVFWDDSAGAAAWLTAGSNLSISGTSISATDTNTTYSAGNGIALSSTTFAVSAGSGLAQESSGLALDDPANLSELTESTDATDDKIFLWDESASAWKYMTLDNLQDAIDTTGGGGGGETAADDITAGDAAVSLATSSGNITVDSNAGLVTVDGHTGVTLQSTNSGDILLDSVADIVLDAAGDDIFLKDAGTTFGSLSNNGGSLSVKAGSTPTEALVIDASKIVDFKIAGGSKTVTLQNDAADATMSGPATVTVNATEWLQIKVAGNTRYIPVWS